MFGRSMFRRRLYWAHLFSMLGTVKPNRIVAKFSLRIEIVKADDKHFFLEPIFLWINRLEKFTIISSSGKKHNIKRYYDSAHKITDSKKNCDVPHWPEKKVEYSPKMI